MNHICGIGGISANRPFNDDLAEVADRLIRSLHRRGGDAFGYMYDMPDDSGYHVHKEPGPIWMSNKQYQLYYELLDNDVTDFNCHTRLATQGDPFNNVNNHPFDYKNFVMAHNGVFYSSDDFKNPTEIKTDSFWALYWIEEEYVKGGSIEERTKRAIDNGLDHVVGAFAIWLYNKDDQSTYIFRNPFKPTKIALAKGKDFFMYASDRDAIHDALGYSEKEPILRVKDITTLRSTPPEKVFRLSNGDIEDLGMFIPNPVGLRNRARFRDDYAQFYGVVDSPNSPLPGVI